jgi:DNA-binding SARP family transcriptional activator/tetratricopeptide (TPR) repeat protein
MEFRVLGPAELWSAGRQCDLGGTRERATAAILLLTPRTIVPSGTLIDHLWDTRPPPKARESLSVYIARLRASLRRAVGDGARLAGRADGYVLDVDPETVDLHRFRRLRREADALTASGDHDRAARLLREADGLWRGQALAGIRGDWVARMRDSLEEERRSAVLQRVELDLELGCHARLVSELRALLAQYPLDETFVAHQMTALYRSGRPADALSLYRETRVRLADEQGTEPGPALADLHQRILRNDPALAGRPPARRAGLVSQPDTLPPETAQFVGRGRELELLSGQAGEPGGGPQVSVIEGMPGVGKTALAVRAARAVADRYPDGAFYLNFRTHDPGYPALDSAEALHRLLAMLGLPVARIPDGLGQRAALWRAELGRRRAVVILDDAARRDQIRPLLPVAGDSLILITARRRLPDLEGARVITLGELSLDDAVTLFTQVAGADRVLDPDQAAAAAGLCGGLPLAIRMTAGRLALGHPGLGDLVEELSRSTAGLDGTGPAGPEVISAFDLSYGALEPDHQRFFRRLGLNPCAEVGPQAAAALAGCTPAEADKALAALVDHHLLAPDAAGRFRIHALVRGYAAARAADDDPAPERRQAVGRLFDYYLHVADQADRVLHPFRLRTAVTVTHPPAARPALGTQEDATAWLESEWRNMLQAARHAGRHEWPRQCADLVHVLAGFVEIRAYWEEAIEAHTLALQACRDLGDPARIAQAALELSVVSQQTGRHEAALALAEEAAAVYRSLGDLRGQAATLDQIGLAHQRAARSREALAYFREAGFLYDDAADRHGQAEALSHSGIACWQLGHYPDGVEHLGRALSLYQDVGDRRGEAKALNNLGKMQLYWGRHREALANYQKSLEIFTELGAQQSVANVWHNIGSVHHYKGRHEEGLAAYQHALDIYHGLGDRPDEADVLNDIAAIYQSAELYAEAATHYQVAGAIAEQIGNRSVQVTAVRGMADVQRGSGQYGQALDHYRAALRIAREIGDPYEEAKVLEGMAETTLSTQGAYAARILFRQALEIFERLDVPEAEVARIRMDTTDPAFLRRTS